MRSQRTKPLEKLHRSVLPVENTRELHDANLSTPSSSNRFTRNTEEEEHSHLSQIR